MSAITSLRVASNYVTILDGEKAIKGAVENAWSDLVLYSAPAINGNNAEHVKAYLEGTVEVDIRKSLGGKGSMPGKYRSAKSVVCLAITKGVALLNPDGTVRGKTAVEKDCKDEKTPEQKLEDLLGKVRDMLADGVGVTSVSEVLVRDVLDHLDASILTRIGVK